MSDIAGILKKHGYVLGSYVGRGSFSQCYLVQSTLYKETFVCKIMYEYCQDKTGQAEGSYLNEINALTRIDNQNIIRCYDHFKEDECYFIILEYCQQGTLQEIIEKNPISIKANTMMYATALINAVYCIHNKGISHLDIKPQNIFLDKYNRPKIGDFGLAYSKANNQMDIEMNEGNIETKNDIYHLLRKRGSYIFMAPEVIRENGSGYDPFKADIWSLGVTLYQIAKCDKLHYSDIKKMWREIYVDCFNLGTLGSIIQSCMTTNPDLRPTICQIKELLISKESRKSIYALKKSQKKTPQASSYSSCYMKQKFRIFVPLKHQARRI